MMEKKFPRTPHLPTSKTATGDDKWLTDAGLSNLKNSSDLLVTEKMDGSNYNMTRERAYARSIDGTNHSWDQPAKTMWGQIRYDIPHNIRLSGESLYATRSVAYENLPSPFLLFAVWENNTLLSWDDTEEWAELLNLTTVPVLYRGNSFEEALQAWTVSGKDETTSEGFVIREASTINYDEYGLHVGKWVRSNHVRTRADWRHRNDYALNTFTNIALERK